MHILYFHQHFATPRGSKGTRSYQIARRLVESGHKVTLVCGRTAGSAIGMQANYSGGQRRGRVDGIDVIELDLPYSNKDSFPRRTLVFIRFALRSVRLALREPCDLVFATTTPLTASIPGIAARWLRRKPFVFEVRDLWPDIPRSLGVITNPVLIGLMSMLEWVSYRSAHRLVGLSPGIVEGIVRCGVPRSRIALVPNGCDLDMFAGDVESWRPDGVSEDHLMAVYAGTLGYTNGLESVLAAAQVLKTRGRDDIRLVLVGDGVRKEALQARALEQSLDNIVFHPPVSKGRVAGLMRSADVGLQLLANVSAFYYGTSPNKFFDYIAAGLPVLNNYPGWVADLLTEHDAGFAVPPDDPEAFAGALEQAADDRAALVARGRHARALAIEQFDRDLLVQRWIDWVAHSQAATRIPSPA